jgi:hypothetical protein
VRLVLGGRAPRFVDELAQVDVSAQYALVADAWRVALDPLCSVAYDLASKDCEWVVLLPLVVLACGGRVPSPPAMVRRLGWCGAGVVGVLLAGLSGAAMLRGHTYVEHHAVAWLVAGAWIASSGALAAAWRWRPRAIVSTTGRVASWLSALLLVNVVLISAPLPLQRIEAKLAPGEALLDLHVHTTASDGFLTPRLRLRWYRAQGVSAAAFSDHDTTAGSLEAGELATAAGDGLEVLLAQEYTSREPPIHLNVVGLAETITPRDASVPELVARAKAAGGFVYVNHYVDDGAGPRPFTLEQLAAMGVDGFELDNGWTDMAAFGTRDEMRAFCRARGLACVSGSDEHENRELELFMRVGSTSQLGLLRRNQHQVVRIERGGPLRVPYAWRVLDDAARFANHLLTMDRATSGTWIAWTIAWLVGSRWRKKREHAGSPRATSTLG